MSCSIIVVGAGASGLVAAYDAQSSCSVIVLEASDRYGGRVKKNDVLADFPVDLGGEWIEATSGRDVLDEIVNDDSVDITVDTFTFALPYFGWADGLNKFIKLSGPQDFGLKFKGSTWFDFIDDYIFSALDINTEIRYMCPVESIDYSSSDFVQVDAACGSFQADRVVVAVPLTVMQDGDIEFKPELSKERQKVLDSVPMPAGAKVFLKFQEKFYPDSFAILSDLKKWPSFSPRYFYDETFGQDTNDNIMGLFSYGKSAEDLYADLNDGEVYLSVMETLDEIFDGQATENILDFVVQNWSRDPFIRGAYSNQTPDKTLLLKKFMQKPLDDRVYFAGEYLPSPNDPDGWGAVPSACFSGRYAVEQLLESL